ncbi:hypothetical protein RclHR1_00300033 [Rhizophagus clarus]|uniref:Uncharacterized protein n=1 Tax=Rhizophagus clarus TaxID=94130 RepID=A0A2Z6RHL1_9GLOM|nr:hypothetical protein RclHR1_00300033 [Rhizophagus clarus]
MLSKSLPSTLGMITPPIPIGFSSNSVIGKGTEVFDVVVENLLENEYLAAEDFLKAFQKPSYKEITDKIIQLEKLENEMREHVETPRIKLELINQEEEDRKRLENEIAYLEKNLRGLNQEHGEIVKELKEEIRMLEEMVGVDNDIINLFEESDRELQKTTKLKESETNTFNRRLESKIDDKERLIELTARVTAELTGTILDSVDACALFYKEKMLSWLESDLENAGNNLRNKFNCLKQLLEPNRETKTGQRWQVLFNSFDNFERNLESLLKQEEIQLEELEKQEDELLKRRSQLIQEVEILQEQINHLRKERERLLGPIPSVNLNELAEKLKLLEKELAEKTEESRSIEEKLRKNEKELKEMEKRTPSPQIIIHEEEKEKEEISRQILNDNYKKGRQLQKEKIGLKKELLKTFRGNEEHFQQKLGELTAQVEELSYQNLLYSELYSLEKSLNSAKAKVGKRNLYGLLNVYKSDNDETAKIELSKELSDEELEALLDEDKKRRRIEEILKELKKIGSQR